jgi:hypothetical protein
MKLEVEFENAYIFLLCRWLVLFHLITFSAITFYSLNFSHVGQGGLGFFLCKGKLGYKGVLIGNIYRYWKKVLCFHYTTQLQKFHTYPVMTSNPFWCQWFFFLGGFIHAGDKIKSSVQSVQKVQNKSSLNRGRSEKLTLEHPTTKWDFKLFFFAGWPLAKLWSFLLWMIASPPN